MDDLQTLMGRLGVQDRRRSPPAPPTTTRASSRYSTQYTGAPTPSTISREPSVTGTPAARRGGTRRTAAAAPSPSPPPPDDDYEEDEEEERRAWAGRRRRGGGGGSLEFGAIFDRLRQDREHVELGIEDRLLGPAAAEAFNRQVDNYAALFRVQGVGGPGGGGDVEANLRLLNILRLPVPERGSRAGSGRAGR